MTTTIWIVVQRAIDDRTIARIIGAYTDQALATRTAMRGPRRHVLTGPTNTEWGKPR